MKLFTKLFKLLWSDFMKTPKKIQIVTVIFLTFSLFFGFFFLTGCSVGPSEKYILKMEERAAKHFPRYKFFIENATVTQLEKILKKFPGKYRDAKEEDIKFLREALVEEIDSWWFLIKSVKKLIKEKNEGE